MLVRWIRTNNSTHLFAIFGAERLEKIKKEDLFHILSEISKKHNVQIQLFDSRLIAGWEHLYFSTIHAVMAFENNYNISKKIEMEILLYSVGKRQIKEAIEIMGLSDNTTNLVCVILAPENITIPKLADIKNEILTKIRCIENDSHFSISDEKIPLIMRTFEISETELKIVQTTLKDTNTAVTHCVLERLSMLPLSV